MSLGWLGTHYIDYADLKSSVQSIGINGMCHFNYTLYLDPNNLQNETELQQLEQKKQEVLCWLTQQRESNKIAV